jgi:DNA ligase (NAD+)
MIDPIKRLLELEGQLKYHDYMYFEKDAPVISDAEYDILSAEYIQLLEDNQDYQTTYGVGFVKPDPRLESCVIYSPMLSVSKRKGKDDFLKWIKDVGKNNVVNEEKLDGMALRLIYQKGILTTIHSRGNGEEGSVLTHRRRLIRNIPDTAKLFDKPYQEYTGEVYCKTADFNEYVIRHGLDPSDTDPRSTVSGIMKRLHVSERDDLPLYFKAYSLGPEHCTEQFDTYMDMRHHLKEVGFDVPVLYSDEELTKLLELTTKPTLDYQIDGIVSKSNDIEDWLVEQYKQYWTYATCYKFPTISLTTKVLGIDWSLSLKGELIGTLMYEPVKYEGTTLRRAKLDYAKSYFDKGLAVGSVVQVTKGNEIIPKLIGLVEKGNGEKLNYPEKCPFCNTLVTLEQDAGKAFCNNDACEGQLIRQLIRLTDKKGLNIKGLGESKLTALLDNGFLSDAADLFKLTEADLVYSGMGESIAKEILNEITKASELSLNRWLTALGIPGLGEVRAIEIANYSVTNGLNDELKFHNVDDLVFMLSDGQFLNDLFGLDGLTIGKYVKANSDKITSFLKHFDFTKVKTGALEGIPVSITGGWNPMTRDMLTDHLRKSGFILSDRVTKTCKILLTGEKPSPAKIEKARGWNIPVVNIISLNDVNSIISLISK